MKIIDLFKNKKPVISFEFFPPKTEGGMENLMATIGQLKSLTPSFVSMTYGAGGSTRQKTVQLVGQIKNDIGIETAAHLTCVGHSKEELKSILFELKEKGIENIVALRGDVPQGQNKFTPNPQGFQYASELVSFIKRDFSFCLLVAGYPEKHSEAPSLAEDLIHLQEKITAGGDVIVTQLFFSNKDYFSYVEKVRALGIQSPLVPGIMPITDVDQVKRFTQMCGAKLPVELLKKLEDARGDKEKVIDVGIKHALSQCEELLQAGAPGIHFYTLNKSHSTQEIFKVLKSKNLI